MSIKRLYWDLETSPNVGFFWRAGHKQFVNYDSIVTERAIICVCWKWEGDSKVHSLTWDRDQSDKALLTEFLKVADEADELVAHNGDGFDLPWFKTRCLFHGLTTLPAYKTVDTLQWAKRHFYFNSNRMDYLARFLGMGGKLHTDLSLWKKVVLEKDREALGYMVKYCKRDVALLERVWKKMAAHVPHKTHVGVLNGLDKWTCPHDGSKNVKVGRGARVTANGTWRYQMQCNDCGRSYSINATAHTAYLEYKKKQDEKRKAA